MAKNRKPERDDRPETYELIGRAIRNWAYLEEQLWLIAGHLLGMEDQFRIRIIMGSFVGSRAKREFLSRLGETYLDDELLAEFRRLLRRMKDLGATRNKLAHGMMFISHDSQETRFLRDVFSSEMDGGLDFDFSPFPLNDLRVHSSSVAQLGDEFLTFTMKMDGHIHTEARVHRVERVNPRFGRKGGSDVINLGVVDGEVIPPENPGKKNQ